MSYIESLSTDGFCVIKKAISVVQINELLELLNSGQINTGIGSRIPRLNKGSQIIYNPFLANKKFFDLFRIPLIDEILRHFLNDEYYVGLKDSPNYILRSMILRSSEKSFLPWHIDSFIPFSSKYSNAMQVIIPFEEFNSKSGQTLIYRGSHQFAEFSPQEHADKEKIVELTAVPGDVVIWDARIWHAAKANDSDNTRWAVIATFVRWWVKQNYQYIRAVAERGLIDYFSDDDLIILGGASETPVDHLQSVDLKGDFSRIRDIRALYG